MNELHCVVCNVTVKSKKVMQTHMKGNRHRNNLEKQNNAANGNKEITKVVDDFIGDIIDDIMKRGMKTFDFFVVIDFEATCVKQQNIDYPHEIIEFPAVVVDGKNGKIVKEWRQYCKPLLNPKLSEFCKHLTGIDQETVDTASPFPVVLDNLKTMMEELGLGTKYTFAIVTDGSYDVSRFLRLSCQQAQVEMPWWAEKWINLKRSFGGFYRTNRSRDLQSMLSKLNLQFSGNLHCRLDDAKNIARIVTRMLEEGATLMVNESLMLSKHNKQGKIPAYVSTMSKVEKEL